VNLIRDTERAFSDPETARVLVRKLHGVCDGSRSMTFMEVCGTHTMSIFRQGLRRFLPRNLRLVSGPGCPVCVTPPSYIDLALALARKEGVTIATFGDLMRVPGSRTSLEEEKAGGADVRVVYSPFDALALARGPARAGRQVVFLGVGFETTSPAVAQAVFDAQRLGISNFRVLVAHRLVIPALEALLSAPELSLDGFILPGHVSVILGSEAYRFLVARGVSGVVTGFEPVDILRSLLTLAERTRAGTPVLENQYARLVAPEGNPRALAMMNGVFRPVDAEWRGLGVLPQSGFALRPEYSAHEALELLSAEERKKVLDGVAGERGCRCGEVLTGAVTPPECPFFGEACTPETPIGPCMVSSEGTCAAWFKYGER
jgi:hydrogenase expression/formation protein HypD